jgi:hypothetical protein
MMPAVVLHKESSVDQERPLPTRADIIARYRQLRAICKDHHHKILDLVSPSAMLQQARRLGLSDGRRLFLDGLEAFDLVSDLLVYTAPAGRSRALDRYARTVPSPAVPDETVMLDAMRNARFCILRMERRHSAAGLILWDNARDEELWLVDEGYETWMREGMLVATRYYTPEAFSMTAGNSLPVDEELIARTLDCVPYLRRKRIEQMLDDPRFAEALYRLAIEGGVLKRVRYRDPPAEGYAA